jgi:hypothetical protein
MSKEFYNVIINISAFKKSIIGYCLCHLNNIVESYSGARNMYSILCLLE